MAEELADKQNIENAATIADTPVDSPVIGKDDSKPKSIREGIKAAVKEIELKVDKTGRLHAEDGKFHPKTVEAPKEAAPVEKPKTEKEASPAPPPAVSAGLPPGWSAETKAFVEALPLEHPLRKDVSKREEEVSKGFKEKSDQLKRYQEIEQVLTAARPTFQQAGVQSDGEAVRRLFAWESYIRANPRQAIMEIARSYGVDLAQNSPQVSQQPQEEIPQYMRPLLDQFGRLNQEFNAFKGDQQRAEEARISQELTDFSKDKPHFERVRMTMGQLMQAGLATDLNTAYDKAVSLSPEVQAELKAEEEAKKVAERAKEQQRLQAQAKAAVSPSTRAPSAASIDAKKGTGVRGSILAAIQETRGNGRA